MSDNHVLIASHDGFSFICNCHICHFNFLMNVKISRVEETHFPVHCMLSWEPTDGQICPFCPHYAHVRIRIHTNQLSVNCLCCFYSGWLNPCRESLAATAMCTGASVWWWCYARLAKNMFQHSVLISYHIYVKKWIKCVPIMLIKMCSNIYV